MMALGRSLSLADYEHHHLWGVCDEDGVLEPTLCMRTVGRKRVLIRNRSDVQAMDVLPEIRSIKRPNLKGSQSLHLHALPLDVLVRIVCGMGHDDLKQLYLTSKTLKEAAMIAKTTHFAFSTPKRQQDQSKKSSANRDSVDFDESEVLQEGETPNAPLRPGNKVRRRFGKQFAEISVNLFDCLSD